LADRGTGRPLTRQDLADRDQVLGLLGRLGRVLVDRVMDRDLADRDLGDRDLGDRDLGDRDLADRDLADRDLADRGLADRGKDRDLADRDKDRDLADRDKDRDLADRDKGRDLADRDKGRDLADRGKDRDLADRDKGRDRVDRDLGRGVADRCRRVLTIGVMRRWVAPWMRLAASAHATTARRLRRQREGSAGMMGLLPVGRRLTGTARRLRVAGTVLRRPVVGTTGGMGPTAA
jgi:hypothetical protein